VVRDAVVPRHIKGRRPSPRAGRRAARRADTGGRPELGQLHGRGLVARPRPGPRWA
jgi:hypothetical protein